MTCTCVSLNPVPSPTSTGSHVAACPGIHMAGRGRAVCEHFKRHLDVGSPPLSSRYHLDPASTKHCQGHLIHPVPTSTPSELIRAQRSVAWLGNWCALQSLSRRSLEACSGQSTSFIKAASPSHSEHKHQCLPTVKLCLSFTRRRRLPARREALAGTPL